MSNFVPRIRGKVGQGDDLKFYFEISLWELTGETQIGKPMTFGTWDTDAIALAEMRKCVQLVCSEFEKAGGHEPSGKFLDMKNGGVLRPWEVH